MKTRLLRAALAALLVLAPAAADAIELAPAPADLAAPLAAALPAAAAPLPAALSAPAFAFFSDLAAALPPAAALGDPPSSAAAAPAVRPRPARAAARAAAEKSAAARNSVSSGAALFDGAAAREALERAQGPDYVVRVMTRLQDGEKRAVVLLGESHLKSPAAAALGRDVIARFQVFGLEGYQNKSRGARTFLDRMNALRRRASVAQPERYGAGSTIDEAARLSARRRQLEEVARRYLDSLTDGQRRALREEAEAAVSRGTPRDIGLVTKSGETLLDAAGLRDALTPRAAVAPRPAAFRLEDGHRPGFAEHLIFHERAVRQALSLFAWSAAAADMIWSGSFANGALITALAGLNWMWLGDLLPPRLLGSPLGALFPLRTGLIRGRDKTMARNLAAASASPSGASPILAVVGADHVPGLLRRLEREYGFTSAELDALSAR